MSDKSEKLRDEGYREGANAERLATIKLLQRVADADDVEDALLGELDRLMTLQASEVSAAVTGSPVERAKALAATMTGARGAGGKDLQDTVAEMMLAQRTGTL